MPLRRRLFALLCLLGSASSAPVQGPDDFLRTFGTIMQPATVQATQAAWAELPSKEVGCINDALHQQGGSLEASIQRGALPSGPRLANGRSNCQKQFKRQEPQPTGSEAAVEEGERGLFARALDMIRADFEERTWAAFWQIVVEGRAVRDVAADLAMSPGAVRVAKSRVLHRLRRELGDLIE